MRSWGMDADNAAARQGAYDWIVYVQTNGFHTVTFVMMYAVNGVRGIPVERSIVANVLVMCIC